MDIFTIILFLVGLVMLIVGADTLVGGASRLAATVGISPLVIGLTVVAFGTSAPELAVTVQSAWRGQTSLALGNVVGSNIFNILFILGVSAMIAPLLVQRQLVRRDVPVLIVVSLLVLAMALDGSIGRVDGIVLVVGLLLYTSYSIRQSHRADGKTDAGPAVPARTASKKTWPLDLLRIAAGLALLIIGSEWLVRGAVAFAEWLGISEFIVGLTILAAGTSLPEVATSIIAGLRGERDIAVGNVVGSNILNILAVLGLSSLVAPSGLPVAGAALHFDLPVMAAAALACLPIFFTGSVIARWEGALFFGYYLAYTAYLILQAAHHDALPAFSLLMNAFVIPITVVTLIVVYVRTRRHNRREQTILHQKNE